jgi:hypothetical protein
MVPRLGTVTKLSDEIRKLTAIKVLFVTGAIQSKKPEMRVSRSD